MPANTMMHKLASKAAKVIDGEVIKKGITAKVEGHCRKVMSHKAANLGMVGTHVKAKRKRIP